MCNEYDPLFETTMKILKSLVFSFVESLGTGMERKAITEEDVQTWKRRRLRGAKSAESLLVLPPSTSIDSTKRMSRLVDETMLMKLFQGTECLHFYVDLHRMI